MRTWLGSNLWLLTLVNVSSGLFFVAGSLLLLLETGGSGATLCFLLGSVLMVLDGMLNGLLRHGWSGRRQSR